jgi:antitoxin component of RelBE/YafQ-DinJ toxin-antitoxin module
MMNPMAPDPELLFGILATGAWIDGTLAPEERALLDRKAGELGLAPDRAARLLELARERRLPFELPVENVARASAFEALIQVGIADGRLAPGEEALLQRVGRSLQVEPDEVRNRLQASLARLRKA